MTSDERDKKVVLHVEDDARVAEVVAGLLRDEGYEVVTTCSAQEGLREIPRVKPDLIVLDVSMPGMSGLFLMRRISGSDGMPRIPVILFTAFGQMVDEAAREKAAACLIKPGDFKLLAGEVNRILGETA